MTTQCAVWNIPAHFRSGGRGWLLRAVALLTGLFSGLAAPQGIVSGTAISPGPDKPSPTVQWRPILVLKLNATPFRTPDARFSPGLAWVNDGKMLAAATNQGLVVWRLAHKQASIAKLVIYPRAGFSQFTFLKPMGIIQRRGSFGVALFVKGENGANPRLVVDWYARKNVKFLRSYHIHLSRVRNSGVGIVAPVDANWFATVPVAAIPRARIHLWNDHDGEQLQVHLPPLRHRFNFAFTGGRGNELVWGTPGIGIHVARWAPGAKGPPSVSLLQPPGIISQRDILRQSKRSLARTRQQIKSRNTGISKQSVQDSVRAVERSDKEIAPHESWLGTLSSGGSHMLLVKWRRTKPTLLGPITAVAGPLAGAGPSEVIHYLPLGVTTAMPAFSDHARFAAFAVLGGFPKRGQAWKAATDIFLIRGRALDVVRWARLPEVVPLALSFSERGRRLALVTNLQIFVFDLPRNNRGARPEGLPFSKVQHLPATPPRPFRSAQH